MTEQNLIDLLFFVARNVVQLALYFTAIACMLERKFSKPVTLVVCVIYTAVSVPLVYMMSSNAIASFIYPLLMFISYGVFFSKEKKSRCFIAVALFMVYLLLLDFAVAVWSLETYGCFASQIEPKTWFSVIFAVITDLFAVVTALPLIMLWNKTIRKINVTDMGLFTLFPLGQAIFLAASSYHTWETSFVDILKNPFIIIAVIISIISDIAMFHAIKENSKLAETQLRVSQMEHEAELQSQYYTSLAEKYAEIREYRHDINNLVSTAEALLHSEISRQEGESMLLEMRQKSENMAIPVYCSNSVLNAVLWHKKKEAQHLGIDFDIDIEGGSVPNIDKTDLCSVFTNLLDNALREAAEQAESFVKVSCQRNMGKTIIEISNSSDKVLAECAKKLKTTKENKNIHGCGMDIVRKITEKYNGRFVLSADGKIARAVVALSLTEEENGGSCNE